MTAAPSTPRATTTITTNGHGERGSPVSSPWNAAAIMAMNATNPQTAATPTIVSVRVLVRGADHLPASMARTVRAET